MFTATKTVAEVEPNVCRRCLYGHQARMQHRSALRQQASATSRLPDRNDAQDTKLLLATLTRVGEARHSLLGRCSPQSIATGRRRSGGMGGPHRLKGLRTKGSRWSLRILPVIRHRAVHMHALAKKYKALVGHCWDSNLRGKPDKFISF
jgi:hypothetical protein